MRASGIVVKTAALGFLLTCVTSLPAQEDTNYRKGDNPYTALLQSAPYELFRTQQELPRGTNPNARKGDNPYTALLQSAPYELFRTQQELPRGTNPNARKGDNPYTALLQSAPYELFRPQQELPRGTNPNARKGDNPYTALLQSAPYELFRPQQELPRGTNPNARKGDNPYTALLQSAPYELFRPQQELPRGTNPNARKGDNPYTALLQSAPYELFRPQQELPRGTNSRKGDNPYTALLQSAPYELFRPQQELPRGTNPNARKGDNPYTALLQSAPYELFRPQQELPRGTNPNARKGDNPYTALLQSAPYELFRPQQELPRGTNSRKGDNPYTAVLQSGVIKRVLKQNELPTDPGHDFSQALIDRVAERARNKSAVSSTEATEGSVLFQLPIRPGVTNTRPGYFSISNYVDQDVMAPDSLLDYACGMRTYDQEDGFNHNGVDYFNFPFGWLTMDQDGAAVVAAADGTIIEKHDGEPDMSCEFSDDAVSNTIVLEHADGTITIYTHMKRNTVTSKGVGDTVEKGDYLGIVGSSGFSTGPHLHFGVMDSAGNLIEPHSGACNSLNEDSWWEEQEEYYETGVSLIATHSDIPEFPDCPGIEQPFLQDQFSAGDSVFVSVFLRDALPGEVGTIEILDPNGVSLVSFPPLEYTDSDHAAAYLIAYGLDFNETAISGAYTYRVTYAGQVMEHTFYIDSGPDAPPPVVEANNDQNGLYFDLDKDGEGYNFVTTPAGTIIYFYGSDRFGNRLWLISDLIPGEFGPGSLVEVTMYESTGGTFGSPVASARALSVWGTLLVDFSTCDSAEAMLDGVDGVKVSQLIKLAGSAGTGCGAGGATSDSPWSGLWFAVVDDGEGYNLIVAGNGSILYYYGFKADGRRLWLISDLIVDELQVGVDVQAVMFESTQGDFDNPVPSAESLVQWGTATITLVDCSNITIVMTGSDGTKTSVTIRLAGVVGLDCSD